MSTGIPFANFYDHIESTIAEIRTSGLWKSERVIRGAQSTTVDLLDGSSLINLCANNYLGLANDSRIARAAAAVLDQDRYGMASVRFICGTTDLHQQLECRLADFLGTEDAILYGSAFDANGGLFETLLDENDAIVSDELNHASIIDGIRLCKAKRYRYQHCNLADVERCLREARASSTRNILVFTDGVFSMDGTIAPLDEIRRVCDQYGALLGIDECHATGVLGNHGRGTHEHHGLVGNIDIITGTLGKALGGASGGFTAARRIVVDLLRQRSRPYLFSNALMPAIAAGSLVALDIVQSEPTRRARLTELTQRFRRALAQLGFQIRPGDHPIVPIMVGEADLASRLSTRLYELGVYAVGFFYPVVPRGKARVRVQMNASVTDEQLDRAIAAFATAGKELGLL